MNRFYKFIIRIFSIFIFSSTKRKSFRRRWQRRIYPMASQLNKDMPLFYLKINRFDAFAFKCLQKWIDTITCFGGDFIIVCDKEDLIDYIYEKINFPNENIKIIKSYVKPLTGIVKNICRTPYWEKATYAHLSTFYHAKLHGSKTFWNIDADDTMIMLSPQKCAELLLEVQKYAKNNKIDAFSLDMHESCNAGVNWTFGITYINEKDWFGIFNNIKNKNWQNKYLECEKAFNLDSYFLYLRDENIANNKSFYAENMYFIHYANILNPELIGYTISIFKDNSILFPIFNIVEETKTIVKIGEKVQKINFNINEEECIDTLKEYFFSWNNILQERERWYKIK